MAKVFTLTAGHDAFTGISNDDNVFQFTPSTLQATDTITGGASGTFLDFLVITAGGTISASQFAGVTNVEELNLSGAGNNVTLTNGLVAGSSIGYFAVVAGGGTDVVDASGITNSVAVAFFAAAGPDTDIGGNGNDAFVIAASNLTSADTFVGGAGNDTLYFAGGGTVAASALANVSGIEGIALSSAGNSVTLTNALVAGSGIGYFAVTGGGGTDTVDATGVTNGVAVAFTAGSANETFLGGNGNNAFIFTPAELAASDTVQGGSGIDNLYLTAAGTVGASAFTNVTGIEGLVLANGANNITLTNGLVAGTTIGDFVVAGGTGPDTVNATGVTNGVAIAFMAGGSNETFLGGNGNNGFVFTAAELASSDTVQGGSGIDNLYLTTAGTVAASAFTNVTGIEGLVLADGNNNITLTNGLIAGSSVGYLLVAPGTGDNIVDASGVTNGIAIGFLASVGNDTYKGGNGTDSFLFASGQLTSADTVVGGDGNDTLWMTTAGTTNIADTTGVSGIEGVYLQSGGTFHFSNGLTSGTTFGVLGSSAVDDFDASAVTTYGVTFQGNGGADVLIGGSQADNFVISDTSFASIEGAAGLDRLTLGQFQTLNFTPAIDAKIHDIDVLWLADADDTNVSLVSTDITTITGAANTLWVVGGDDDQVNAGTGWHGIAVNVVNTAVAPSSVHFTEYQNNDGAILYVQKGVSLTIDAGPVVPHDQDPDTANQVTEGDPTNTYTGLQVNSTDLSGGTVSYSLDDSAGGRFGINSANGMVFVTAFGATHIDFETSGGSYDIVATATSGILTNSISFTINVLDAPPSHATDANGATNSVPENSLGGTSTGLTASSTDPGTPVPDPDGTNTVTYSLAADAGGRFVIDPASGVVTVADGAALDYETATSYSITVRATDPSGAFSDQPFTINLSDLNDNAPAFTSTATPNVAENTTAVVDLVTTDPDTVGTNPATLTITGGADQALFQITGGNHLAFIAARDFETQAHSYAVQVTANDGTNTTLQNITVTLTDVNDNAPVFTSSATDSVAENTTAVVDLTTTDADTVGTNPPTFTITGGADQALFQITGGNHLAFIAAPDYETQAHSYAVQVTANDGTNTTPQNITVTLTDVNDNAPIFDSGSTASTPEAVSTSTAVYTAHAPDADGTAANNTVTYSLASGGDNDLFNINSASGAVTFKVTPNFEAPTDAGANNVYDITVHAIDNGGVHDVTQAVAITVTDLPPDFTVAPGPDSDASANQVFGGETTGGSTGVHAFAADPATGAVTYSLPTGVNNNDEFSIDSSTGVVTAATTFAYDNSVPANNNLTVTVRAADASGDFSEHDYSITIQPNQPPAIDAPNGGNPASLNVAENTTAVTTVHATDPDSGPNPSVSYSITGGDDAAKFSIVASGVGAGTLTFLTAPDFENPTDTATGGSNTYIVVVSASDGAASDSQTITVNVTNVNELPVANPDTGTMTEDDAPTLFNVISNDTLDPDAGALNTISIGPGSVTVTGPAGETFANTDAQAAISSNEIQVTLTNAAFQQLTGSEHATVTVPYTLTGNSPGDTSSTTLTVTVNGVNDTPTANDDSGTITEDQVGTFSVLSNDVLDADHGAPNSVTTGTVTNLVAPSGENIDTTDIGVSVNGSNQVVVTLGSDFQHMEQGETTTFDIPYTLHGDQAGDTSSATLHVTVNGVNDAPTVSAVSFTSANSANYNTDLIVNDPTDGAPSTTGPFKEITPFSLLTASSAADVDGPNPLTFVAGTVATANGGSVTIQADGDFVFTPKVGDTHSSDSFTFTVTDGNTPTAGTASATATINFTGPHIWYVNASAGAGGDGSSEHPYNDLSHFNGAGGVDSAGDIIFLETSATHYTAPAGGLQLENNEQLISQSNGLVVSDGGGGAGTVTLVAAGGANAVVDGGVLLGSGDTIQGVDFGTNAGGFALSGSSVGTVHVDDVTSGVINNSTGGGVSIAGSSNVLNMNFSSVTTGGGTSGIALTNSSGAFHAHSGGTISGASSADVSLNGGSLAFTLDGAINDATGTEVSISNMTGGTQSFTGAIGGSGGGGIALSTNTGATMDFSGGMNLSTGASNAFSATGGGTVNVTGTNHLTTTTGTALNVANTTIGGSGLTFHDISANGAASGIVLNNTGGGHLSVTGDGSTVTDGSNSSGGTIQSTTGAGISLTSTTGASFTNMLINNTGGSGITGTGVHDFTFNDGKINNSGTSLGAQMSNIAFNTQSAGTEDNVDGAISIQGNVLTNAYYHGVSIFNFNGTISDANISSNTITSATAVASSLGQGIQFFGGGSSTTVANVTKAEINNNTITNFPSGVPLALQFGTSNASGPSGSYGTPGSPTNIIQADNNTLTSLGGNHVILATLNGRGQGHYDISNNNLSGAAGNELDISAGGAANLGVKVNGNTIDGTGQLHGTFFGIAAGVGTFQMSDLSILGSATMTVAITNNTITNPVSTGIEAHAVDGAVTLNATITGNNVGAMTFDHDYGIQVRQESALSGGTTNLAISGNTAHSSDDGGGTVFPGIGIRMQGGNTFHILNLSPSPANDAQMEAYVSGQNPGSQAGNFGTGGTASIHSPATFTTIGSVPQPLISAPGGVDGTLNAHNNDPSIENNLTQTELNSVVTAAIGRWAEAGASADQIAILEHTTYDIAALSSGNLGLSTPGHSTFDSGAAGSGWFIDPTPNDDAEFGHALSATSLQTDPTEAPAGHMDLLTTVMHEMGLQLGLSDNFDASASDDVMYGYLAAGERRLPDTSDVVAAQQTATANNAVSAELALPAGATAPGGTPIVAGGEGNDTFHIGLGGTIVAGGAGADAFVFDQPLLATVASAPVTHIADYSALQGDTIDLSALTANLSGMKVTDAMVVHAAEDASGAFANLQINTAAAQGGDHWVTIAQLDGVHAGDAVNVVIDPTHAPAQIHADWLV